MKASRLINPMWLPVVGRELRVSSRRQSTYRTRAWAALLAILVFGWALMELAARQVPAAAQGRPLFLTLAVLAFVYCLLIGARVTADCLSEEKREGTLGLLFLTDLKGYDVVLGKLAATALHAFYGLLAVLPLLVLPLQLGGVTGRQITQTVLVLLNSFFFSLCLGLFVSARSTDDRKASFATFGLLLLFVLSPLVLAVFLDSILPPEFEAQAKAVACLSAVFPFELLYSELRSGPMMGMRGPFWAGFWISLVFYHALGWFFLWRAAGLLPRVWQSDAKLGWMAALQQKVDQWGYGRAEQRRQHRARLLDINPFLWLVARDRWKPRYVWVLLAVAFVLWPWLFGGKRNMLFDRDLLLPSIILLNSLLKIWITSEACARLVADRRAGTLELLLSTPLSIQAIIRGQWLALRRQFLIPLLTALFVEFYALRHSFDLGPTLAYLALLILDGIALGWVSLWTALSAKNAGRALTATLGWVLLLPWILYCILQYAVPDTYSLYSPNYYIFGLNRIGFNHRVYLWFVLGLLVDLTLAFAWARPRLRRGFRLIASEGRGVVKASRRQGLYPTKAEVPNRPLSAALDSVSSR